MTVDIATEARKLLKTVWSTQGSRFTAHRRMSIMHQWSSGAVAVASIYVVTVTLSIQFLTLSPIQEQLLGLVAIVSAVGILVLSVLEAGQRYEVRGERLHDCGLELGALCGQLDLFLAGGCIGGVDQLETLRQKYDQILKEHKENHHPSDYYKFCASKRDEFGMGWIEARWWEWLWQCQVLWRFASLILVPIIAGYVVLRS